VASHSRGHRTSAAEDSRPYSKPCSIKLQYENWPPEVNARSLSLARFSMTWPLGWKLCTGYESLADAEGEVRPKRSDSPGVIDVAVLWSSKRGEGYR
jgi:hypothetical protein